MIKRSFRLFAASALVFTLAACDGDPEPLEPFEFTEEIDASSVAVIVGTEVEFTDGSFFGTQFAGDKIKIEFTSATTYRAEGNGVTEEGNVAFGSCTFTPASGSPKTFDPCRFSTRSEGSSMIFTFGPNESIPVDNAWDIVEVSPGLCQAVYKSSGLPGTAQFACDTGS